MEEASARGSRLHSVPDAVVARWVGGDCAAGLRRGARGCGCGGGGRGQLRLHPVEEDAVVAMKAKLRTVSLCIMVDSGWSGLAWSGARQG